jgi:lipopolysaccharide export system ATP-binding protein
MTEENQDAQRETMPESITSLDPIEEPVESVASESVESESVESESVASESVASESVASESVASESVASESVASAHDGKEPVHGFSGFLAPVSAHSRLIVRNLRKRYKARTVVTDVSFQVESGEVVGLLGPNGAGKTTCFYMVVGLVAGDGGEIFIDDVCLTHLPIHRRARMGISYLPQEASVFRKLTVEENIAAVLELQNLGREAIRERLEILLEDLHITQVRHTAAAALSGGERRRVEIARALASAPRFILLDEPFAGVDPIAVLDIQKIIRFLKERGIGVLITDHNVRETLGICDHAWIINEGRVLAYGPPAEIVYNEDVRKVYLGEHFRL